MPRSNEKHPTEINGWEGSFHELAQHIHRMRYDRIHEFYRVAVAELRLQAKMDRATERTPLADLLEEAAVKAEKLEQQFEHIWALSKPRP